MKTLLNSLTTATNRLKSLNLFIDEPEIIQSPARLRRVKVTNPNGALSVEIDADSLFNYDKTIKYLDVENNPRYTPRNGNTYCNVYAHDFAEHFGVYLPRVYWNAATEARLIQNPKIEIKPLYGQNVIELNANSLCEWLKNCANRKEPLSFGWIEVDLQQGIQLVNAGTHFGVICARRRDRKRSGHITVMLPNRTGLATPVQSQAGLKNMAAFGCNRWHLSSNYDAWGCFVVSVNKR